MQLQILALTAVLALIAKIVFIIHRELTSPLRKVPGPFLARITRLWYFRSVYDGQAHRDNINLHRQYAPEGAFYAPIVRLGPNLYSITQPHKAVYGIASKMEKSSWYQAWKNPSPDRWSLFVDNNIQRHAETRRNFQSMYSMSSLLHYEPYVQEVQSLFQQKLEKLTKTGEAVDLHHWLQCYAFDVIGSITFGSRFGFLDDGVDIQGCMASVQAVTSYSCLAGIYVWFHPLFYNIMEKLPRSGAKGREYLTSIVQRKIAERKTSRTAAKNQGNQASTQTAGARDFLDVALDASEDPEKGMTPYNVLVMALSNVFAGSDTTAVSLSSIVWHLMRTPRAMSSLRAELDQAIKDGKMTRERISFKESQNLTYLQACIKEALRLCSATGLPLWRVVPKGGVQMLNHFFPEGTEVGINTWVAHFDQDVWGPDAAEFRPERWIEAAKDSKLLKQMESYYMPFGLGSRTCLGRHISYLEINTVIPMLVSMFDFQMVQPTESWEERNNWFIRPTNFRVHVKPRQ